ncbi:SixA phosphatase family protein [Salinactinospora qingdaonensis]|uniref:Histidine phosphatase family protein n=1 Tax=Salinactinospora qingdaonensis TaxID=702744 RepID=A0ABP7F964_9ACTN
MSRLLLLRHAKAEHTAGVADVDRALTGKGRAQATAVGTLLGREETVPDHVICSPSQRTRQTLDHVVAELPSAPTVDYAEPVYTGAPDDIFELINMVDPEVATLMVVGHNPTISELAATFFERPETVSLSTAGVAVVEMAVSWLYAAPGTGTGRLLT